MSDARDALAEAMGKAIWLTPIHTVLDHKMAADHALDVAPAVTFPDECPTCGGEACDNCNGFGVRPRHALAAFAVEQDAEAVIAELVRAGVLVTLPLEARSAWTDAPIGGVAFYCRALPDEVQTEQTEER